MSDSDKSSKKNAPKEMSAVKLRLLLISVILLIIAALATGIWYSSGFLSQYADTVKTKRTEASEIKSSVTSIEELTRELESNEFAFKKSQQVVADSNTYTYEYQDVIIKDIVSLAAQSGIAIDSYTFELPTASGSRSSSSSSSTAAKSSTPEGLKSLRVNLTAANGSEYPKILDFIHRVEQNLTRMQIDGVSVTYDRTKNELNKQALTIEVYTK